MTRAFVCLALVIRAASSLGGESGNETHVWDAVSRRLMPRPRIECTVGWGQYNDDNIRLHIKKEWTRVCYYCFSMGTGSSEDMEKVVVGSPWDEQQFYRSFYIEGCGGMFGTPKFIENNNGCNKGTIEIDTNNEDEPIGSTAEFSISCCAKQDGCSSASTIFKRGVWIATCLLAFAAHAGSWF